MIYRSVIDSQLMLVNHEMTSVVEARLFPVYRASLNLEQFLINVSLGSPIETTVLPIVLARASLDAVMLSCINVVFYKDSEMTQEAPGCEVLVGTGNSQSYVFHTAPAAVYHNGYKDLGKIQQGRLVELSYLVKVNDSVIGVPENPLTTFDSGEVDIYLNQAGLYVSTRDPRYKLPALAEISVDGASWSSFELVSIGPLQIRPQVPEACKLYDELIEVVAIEVVDDLDGVNWSVENGQLNLDYAGTVQFDNILGEAVSLLHSGGTIGGAYVTNGLILETTDAGSIAFNITATCLLVNKVGVTTQRLLGTLYKEIDLTPGVNPVVT